MKKIILLLFLCISLSGLSQIGQPITNTPSQTWKSKINSTFQGLNKNKVPHGVLLDFAMEFGDVTKYNGALSGKGNKFVDIDVLSNIYKTLFMGRVTIDTLAFPRMETLAKNWALERVNQNQTEQSTIVLGGMYYKYAKIAPDALAENKITVSNNKYYDKYINGVWQNPYEVKETVAFAPAINTYNKAYFNVVLPQELMLSNQLGAITKIEFDADDGQGYRELTYDQPVSVFYYQNKTYTWTYRIEINNTYYLYSRSQIKIEADAFPQHGSEEYDDNVVISGPGGLLLPNGAVLRIDYAPAHNGQLQKPFIVAEGFDPGSITEPETEGGERTLRDFKDDVTNIGDLSKLLIGNTQEYDIVYIDWQNGVGRLQDNSVVLENAINWVNDNKVGNEQNVLLGQSMGGAIGRYTLARMEQENNNDHDMRLFVSHDAPLKGSNTPISTQYFTRHLYNEYVEVPVLYDLGEVVLPIVIGLAELIESAINELGGNANFEIAPYVSPEDILTLQDTPAAVQLNYEWVNFDEHVTPAIHQNWQQEFEGMGYPQNSRNVAISNGNECAVDHGFNPGDNYVTVHDTDNPDFLGDLLHMLANPIIGGLTNDIDLIILGSLPGSSKYYYDFDVKSTPNLYDTNREVYYGRIRYEKKLLWLIPITHTLTERSKDATNGSLPFGSYSGGSYDIETVTDEFPQQFPPTMLENPRYGFIPVVSALDVQRNGGIQPNDYLKKYAGGNIQNPGLSTQFDNFIVDYRSTPRNNEHISFQPRNGNWLANELNASGIGTFLNNIADCSFLCDDEGINGPDTFCTTANYSISASNNAIINWSLSPSNAGQIQLGQGSNQIQLSLNSNYSGNITINANVTIPNCGSKFISKEAYAGKPSFTVTETPSLNYVDLNMIGTNGATMGEQGITNSTWQVTRSTFGGGLSGAPTPFYRKASGQGYDWAIDITVTATNACGTTTKSFYNITPPAPDPCGQERIDYAFMTNENGGYILNPDPDPCDEERASTNQMLNNTDVRVYDFTGNRVMTHKRIIDLSNLSPGIYILKATINGEVVTKKVMK